MCASTRQPSPALCGRRAARRGAVEGCRAFLPLPSASPSKKSPSSLHPPGWPGRRHRGPGEVAPRLSENIGSPFVFGFSWAVLRTSWVCTRYPPGRYIHPALCLRAPEAYRVLCPEPRFYRVGGCPERSPQRFCFSLDSLFLFSLYCASHYPPTSLSHNIFSQAKCVNQSFTFVSGSDMVAHTVYNINKKVT